MDERRICATTEDGVEIVGLVRGDALASEQVVILLHGFSSGKNNATNQALLAQLELMGLPSLRFDFRGCYESSGDVGLSTITTGLLDLRSVLDESDISPDQVGVLVGSSFGAAVALAAAGEIRPQGIALRSPMVDIAAVQRERRGDRVMEQWRKKGFIEEPKYRLSYEYVADAEQYDLQSAVGELGRVPITVVHGDRDDIVPHHFSQEFVAASPTTRTLVTIPGAGHRYDGPGEFDQMIGALRVAISAFIGMSDAGSR